MSSEAEDPEASAPDSSEGEDGHDPSGRTESADESADRLYDTVNFSPNKADIYTAIKADVDVDEAFLELVDNAIDNWERVSSKTDPLQVEIFQRVTDDGEREVVVRDNSGGVRVDELAMLFALGHSAKSEVAGSVGAYGVGGKKAILRLADEATIVTRYKNAETGYGFTVGKEWLNEEGWERPVEEFDVPQGVTEIRLRRLNFNLSSKFEDLEATLSSTYEIFLGGGPRPDVQDYDFELRVEDEVLEADGEVNWSFPPFDGLHPRQFRGIELDSRAASEPVKLHVTVGVLQRADVDESGTDVFIQNRKVHNGAKNEQGGFGVDRHMGQFEDSRHKRLKIIVELETDGDARDLPWSSSKNTLDLDSQIAQQAFNWVARIAQNYYRATYDALPQTLLRPYGRGQPHAVEGNLGEDAYQFTNDNVTKPYKPVEGYPEAKRIRSVAEAHARLGIRYPDALSAELQPAYREHWNDVFDRKYGDYFDKVNVPSVSLRAAPGLNVDEVDSIIERIDGWAERDARAGQRYDDLDVWEEPRYEATLRRRLPEGEDLAELAVISERPDSGDDPGDEPTGASSGDDGTDGSPDELDRTEFTIEVTGDQETLYNEVLATGEQFHEMTPAERSDAFAERLDRLQAVLEIAGGTGATAD